MGQATDKARNASQKTKGKVKEAAGSATGNRSLEREGKSDRAKGTIKQKAEKIKDVPSLAVRRHKAGES